MTWFYESFWVRPHGWNDWSKSYPHVECRWRLRVVRDSSGWKIVTVNDISNHTNLDQEYLDLRFDTWEEAVSKAHDLVSTVATSRQNITWPEAKAFIEANNEATLF